MQGIGIFPTDSEAMAKYTTLFQPGKNLVVAIFPTLILIRAMINLSAQKGAGDYFLILKDSIYAVLLLVSFTSILGGLIELPHFFGEMFGSISTFEIKNSTDSLIAEMLSSPAKWLTIIAFYWTMMLYTIVYLVSAAIAAYVIVLGLMLQASWVLKIFFSLLAIASAWPLFWYILNSILTVSDGSPIVENLLLILVNLVKLFIPIVGLVKLGKSSGFSSFAKDSTVPFKMYNESRNSQSPEDKVFKMLGLKRPTKLSVAREKVQKMMGTIKPSGNKVASKEKSGRSNSTRSNSLKSTSVKTSSQKNLSTNQASEVKQSSLETNKIEQSEKSLKVQNSTQEKVRTKASGQFPNEVRERNEKPRMNSQPNIEFKMSEKVKKIRISQMLKEINNE